ncbi:MAG TPA: M20/M25/M40 family metallo-hydrolase [Ignavibacteriaceae bacterium]|nr:M20/M25/M40 family metallo-hydrolase [Ignavibacteriaceae bacterium]
MKKIILVFMLLLGTQSILFPQSPTIQTIINQTNLDSLMYFVEELSGEVSTIIGGSPYTIVSRHKNNASNNKAADYIKQKLNSYGLVTYDQNFSSTGRNVYGVQLGTVYPNKEYIICAHYDDMPSGATAPGADDNASGTAAVIEAARIFTQYNSKYTIIYALWDEEEQGLVGSAYYAQQAALAGDSIMGVINMDMIAWDSDNDSVGEIHIRNFGNSVALKDLMLQVNTTYSIGVIPSVINPGTTASDQASFWNNGYGALLLIEEYYGGDFNGYYHTINDRIIHFNQPYFHKMSRLTIGTVATLADLSDIVPVELLAFTASVKNSDVELLWSTASELNNMGFEIERSIDNQDNFITVGFVDGKGSSSEINYYSFTDHPQLSGVNQLYYRLKQVDFDGTFSYSDVANVSYDVPAEFVLGQNYPNPFNPSTRISYFVPQESFVSIKVYDFLGREVMTLVNEARAVGSYEISFDASNMPSGTYFYTLIAENYSSTKKMILIK